MQALLVLLCLCLSILSIAAEKGKVLVIVSSAHSLDVVVNKETKATKPHPTGFFLSEAMVPIKALRDAGYEVVIANPLGNPPALDEVSDQAMWFKDAAEHALYRKECEAIKLCSPAPNRFAPEKASKLSEIVRGGLDKYVAVYFPGGHAPMQDLWFDLDVRGVLEYAHKNKITTAAICHGPIALLASHPDPEALVNTIPKGTDHKWQYAGYRMTVFSSREEKQEEPGEDNVLGGYVKFYPDEALDTAGGKVLVRGRKWQSNVVVDRELITGQNPFSHHELAEAMLKALKATSK
jgi:putative intracellular protease/amidase